MLIVCQASGLTAGNNQCAFTELGSLELAHGTTVVLITAHTRTNILQIWIILLKLKENNTGYPCALCDFADCISYQNNF